MSSANEKFEQALGLAISVNMKDRQAPLMAEYKRNGKQVNITDSARTSSARVPAATALYSEVIAGHGDTDTYSIGVHEAVGGLSDFPTPGDVLCAAIASCLDSTIRIIASRLSIPLKSLSVCVQARIDVRGTLRVDDSVPVGFQGVDVEVDLQAMMQLPESTLNMILKAAEHSCVVIQTLRNPPPIEVSLSAQKQIAA